MNQTEFKLVPESIEDLWHLSMFIEIGDIIESVSKRKIKKEGSNKVVIKKIFVKLLVEKIEFKQESGELKVLGKIQETNEDISGYHSIHITEDSQIKIIKSHQPNKYLLKKMLQEKDTRVFLGVVFDNHDALIFKLNSNRITILEKKVIDNNHLDNYKRFDEFFKIFDDYVNKIECYKIILGFSVFWKKTIEDIIQKYSWNSKAIMVNLNNPSLNGIHELITSSEMKNILKDVKLRDEEEIIKEILKRIRNNDKIEYGSKVYSLISSGAVDTLIVSEDLIMADKSVLKLMNSVESMGGIVKVIETEDSKKVINNLGKIVAFLRYNLF